MATEDTAGAVQAWGGAGLTLPHERGRSFPASPAPSVRVSA